MRTILTHTKKVGKRVIYLKGFIRQVIKVKSFDMEIESKVKHISFNAELVSCCAKTIMK